MINEDGEAGERNGIFAYWKKLAVVLFGCLCLFVFDMCERGVQLRYIKVTPFVVLKLHLYFSLIRNPFFSIWVTDLGTNLALGFIILAGLSAGVFFLFLCFMIYKVFMTISQKQVRLHGSFFK